MQIKTTMKYHSTSVRMAIIKKSATCWRKSKCESESCSVGVGSDSLWPHGLYTAHGVLQARILEWVAFSFSRRSSQPRDQIQVSRIAGRFFTSWATRKTKNTEWVAYPFSCRSSWPRNLSGVSCIAGRFFTNWAIREAMWNVFFD